MFGDYRIFQYLVPLIGVFFISRTIYQYLHNKRSAGSTLVWFIFWICIMVLAILPDKVSVNLAGWLGFKSNVMAIVFVALGMLFVFVFYISSTIERLELQVTDLVRKLAIEEAEKNRLLELQKKRDKKRKEKRQIS